MAPLTSQKQIAGLAGWLIASFIAAATGALLVPYLLWVSFAAALNYSVWQLNPQVLG
jgi:tryptophan-rich sensory protein